MNEKKQILQCQSSVVAMVDIMVLAYNHGEYIEQALDSILMQRTEFTYRILVGEDCSTDNTRQIVLEYYEKFPDKMEIILWEKNVGAIANETEIMRNCKAKYIAVLEGDDYWTDSYKLQKQVSFLEANSAYVGTAHNILCVDEKGKLLHKEFRQYPISDTHIYGKVQALKHEMISQTASLVYRNVYMEWDNRQWEFFEKFGSMNLDVVLQVFLGVQGDLYFFSEIMANHRKIYDGNSWTSMYHRKNKFLIMYKNRIKLNNFLKEHDNIKCSNGIWEKSIWEESKKRFLCDFSAENLKVCCQLFFLEKVKRQFWDGMIRRIG